MKKKKPEVFTLISTVTVNYCCTKTIVTILRVGVFVFDKKIGDESTLSIRPLLCTSGWRRRRRRRCDRFLPITVPVQREQNKNYAVRLCHYRTIDSNTICRAL